MQIVIIGTLSRVIFVHPWYSVYIQYFFNLKWAIEMSLNVKWGPSGKIWDWCIIQYYSVEHVTPMLTLGPRSCRSSNLVLDLKLWENLETNLPECLLNRGVAIWSCWQPTFVPYKNFVFSNHFCSVGCIN